jgi:hypothetical protein
LLLFYERWDPEKPCGTQWTSERVLQEFVSQIAGTWLSLPSCFFPSRLCRFFPFFLPLASGAPIPPTRLWHKICKKVKKKDFFDKS